MEKPFGARSSLTRAGENANRSSSMVQRASFRETCFPIFIDEHFFTYASTRYDATHVPTLVKLYETMATRARKNAYEIPSL